MTLALRPAAARGHANFGWLDSHHTFSFANYHDPRHMGFRQLRVINDDTVSPDGGFDTHGHRDMEIISYVVRGALAHRDTTGGDGVLQRGDVQAMSAGTGVRHSEFNGSGEEDVRFLQIWVLPERDGLKPAYRQAQFSDEAKRNQLRLIVAPGGPEGSLHINQDVRVYASLLDGGASVSHQLAAGRGAWVQVVDGDIEVNGKTLTSGDGLAIEDVERLDIAARGKAEFLLFDLG
ncbi:MAG TPA: pirin family protein [Verrucomicrobiae bacterium]|nr:pirin family protein [Verrucomicrobiae bacterium]